MAKTVAGMAGELRYAGKVTIVTGGTRGIGEGITREFVFQGAKVVFCAPECERQRGEDIQKELEEAGCPGEALFVVCDVLSEEQVKNLVSVTISRYGCLDCLVNNAGVHPPYEETDSVTAASFRYLLDLNVVGYFLTAKYCLPYLRETKGNIVNIASIVVLIGDIKSVPYVATKGAIAAMTKALALDESKYGVRVNSISPGNIWTPLWQKIASEADDPEKKIQEGIDAQLLGRFGTPADIAKAVLFMAGDAPFCTGADLLVTGGAELGFAKKNQQGDDDAKGVKGVKG